MRYKGYVGVMEVDPDADLIHGDVIGLRDVITFQGRSVSEAQQAFKDSVDDYLKWCAEDGRAPEKPFSGNIMVRLDPAIHRSLFKLAEIRSMSINSLAVEALAKLASDSESEIRGGDPVQRRPSSKQKARRSTASSGRTKTAAAAKRPGRPTRP